MKSHRLRWLAPHSPRAPGGPRLSRSRYLVRGFIPARAGHPRRGRVSVTGRSPHANWRQVVGEEDAGSASAVTLSSQARLLSVSQRSAAPVGDDYQHVDLAGACGIVSWAVAASVHSRAQLLMVRIRWAARGSSVRLNLVRRTHFTRLSALSPCCAHASAPLAATPAPFPAIARALLSALRRFFPGSAQCAARTQIGAGVLGAPLQPLFRLDVQHHDVASSSAFGQRVLAQLPSSRSGSVQVAVESGCLEGVRHFAYGDSALCLPGGPWSPWSLRWRHPVSRYGSACRWPW